MMVSLAMGFVVLTFSSLEAMAENFIHDMHNVRIVARIKAHNLPSRRILEKLGFHTIGDDNELLLHAKDLGPPS